jgi:hypothetical protein
MRLGRSGVVVVANPVETSAAPHLQGRSANRLPHPISLGFDHQLLHSALVFDRTSMADYLTWVPLGNSRSHVDHEARSQMPSRGITGLTGLIDPRGVQTRYY